MAKVVDVVVLVVSTLCACDASDTELLTNLRTLVGLCPGVALGLYECPMLYHRLLSNEALHYAASCGSFLFLKDTCRNTAVISERLALLRTLPPTPFRWYNGNVTTLLHSLRQGEGGSR